MGQGLHTKVAQVAASAFNISLSSVFISETSTDKVIADTFVKGFIYLSWKGIGIYSRPYLVEELCLCFRLTCETLHGYVLLSQH